MNVLVLILISVLLLALNGFFVLAEFAFVKVRPTQLDDLIAQGSRSARRARRIVSRLDAYLSTIQLGITVASLGLGWIAEPAFAGLIESLLSFSPFWNTATAHTLAFALAFSLITTLHVVLGELVPKSLAIRSPEWYARACGPALDVFHVLFYVPMWLLNSLALFILRLMGNRSHVVEYGYTPAELKQILSASHREGSIDLADLILFENLFDFGTMTVRDAMRSFDSAETWNTDSDWRQNLARLSRRRHSRFPVASGGRAPDAYVHVKDIVYGCLGPDGAPAEPAPRKLPRIAESMRLDDAFRLMQKGRAHMAVVTDPGQKPVGLVTTEDIIEEIFGEIRDEFETTTPLALASLFDPDAADLDLPFAEKHRSVRHLLERLARHRPLDVDVTLNHVLAREKLFPTAVGKGVAIPHARLPGLAAPLFTIGLRSSGVDYEAPDKEPVRILFLLLTPASEPQVQVRVLSKFSRLLTDEDWRAKILGAQSGADLLSILSVFDQMTIS